MIATPSRPWFLRAVIWCLVLAVGAVFAGRLSAQEESALQNAGAIRGTVKDPSGAVIVGAVVTLEADGSGAHRPPGAASNEGETRVESPRPASPLCASFCKGQRTTITDESGQFQFSPVGTGQYTITISASGFEVWTAKDLAPSSGENPISAVLRVAPATAQVNVVLPPRELAVEQVKAEEKQRIIGVFPNFFVTYEPNPAPLTASQKFQLG
jgi:Carboxypeptidase regulatory-like domain